MEGVLSSLYQLAVALERQYENPSHSPAMHTLIRSMGIQTDVMAELVTEQLDDEGIQCPVCYPCFDGICSAGMAERLQAIG